jgi:long-chain fatty acid transport protein
MGRVLLTAGALAFGASAAVAGGVERSTQSVNILFEDGNYAELTYGHLAPDVSGVSPLTTAGSGDMAGDYSTYSLGVKTALTDKLDLAVIIDQPIGADVDYADSTGCFLQGTNASIDSTAVTALLRYKLPQNFSVIGGIRALQSQGVVQINTLSGARYHLQTSDELDFGYVLGVAWEKPEIAARVALTYNSEITHKFQSTETFVGVATDFESTFETTVPQSVNLEFQTGVAADTLVFGSVRWVNWSAFDINPDLYRATFGGNLVDYPNDVVTWNLGLGRKFNENWSGAVLVGYEKKEDDLTGNLGPHSGMKSIGLAATYTKDHMKITAGVRYVEIGDATTKPAVSGVFTDNSGIGWGIKVGYSF